ncbi:tripeptidyl-peptidase 2-like isoform X3 [Convolutriloba macropyga]|uniref:tripeptidyl-peptidase 2-like isoform X3 n=1 Tax=Convolutriloba macropyga TaxID=536237 RepID=UPI003F51CC5E
MACLCGYQLFSIPGDLETCKVLRPYKEEADVGRISQECLCNFTVNVYGFKGETTVINATSSPHGTHVAGIAAAYRSDNLDLNGVAPGAQIVSIKIGDSRLNAMETGSAMIRAMEYCNKNKIDIANYSFGEPAAIQKPPGRIMEAIERSIHQFNLCFFTSHGNRGPGLCTGGAPANFINGGFSITAYLSPAMRKAQYALDNPSCPSQHYYWSSRGPCMNGGLGVSVCAPGAAITSVPQELLKGEELMNGTSMASPNAAGTMALVLSGLKQLGLNYTPYSIERSMKNTALKMPNHCFFSSGAGVVQSLKSFNHLKEFTPKIDSLAQIYFKGTTKKGQMAGIFLHKKSDFDKSSSRHYVSLETKFAPKVKPELKVDFSIALALQASEPWLSVPSCLYMTNSSRGFFVTVETSQLKPGAHYAEICVYDEKNFDYGPLFRFPVTVIKALNETSFETEFSFDSIQLSPGALTRRFFRPPEGSSFVTIKLTSLSSENSTMLSLDCVQIKEATMHSDLSHHKQVLLESEATSTVSYKCEPSLVMEVCLAGVNTWSANSFVRMDVSFHGVTPSCESFAMHHFALPLRIDLKNSLARCNVDPSGVVNHLVTPLRPSDFKIVPLDSPRDCNSLESDLESGELSMVASCDSSAAKITEVMYGLELTYNYSHNVKEKEVFPECLLFSSMLYESPFDSQFWVMYDSNKQVMGYGDFAADKYACSLNKGDYTIKLWIRHPKYDLLEKLQCLQFIISRKVPNISLSFYSSINVPFKLTSLGRHESTYAGVSRITDDKLPKQYISGSYLTGKISLLADEPGKSCCWYPFTYHLGPPFIPKKEATAPSSKEQPAKEKTFAEFMKEAKMSYLQKKSADLNEDDVVKMYEELTHEFSDDLNIQIALATYLASGSSDRQEKNREKLISVCDAAIDKIDTNQILRYLGCQKNAREDFISEKRSALSEESKGVTAVQEVKTEGDDLPTDSETESSEVKKSPPKDDSKSGSSLADEAKEIEKRKTQLVELLQKKCSALLDMTPVRDDDVEKCFKSLKQFMDPFTETKTTQLMIKYCRHKKLYGLVAAKLMTEYENNNTKASLKSLKAAFADLKWNHAVDRIENSTLLVRFPPSYVPF